MDLDKARAVLAQPNEYTHVDQRAAAVTVLAELDAARARVAELEAVVDSLRYRMTCVDPPPTFDEIAGSLARVATRRTDR